ncbi:hypothetical protein [Hyphomonas sp.]|uniref:hypothetical protein n=1 Tax=Hyphomonas sp. TaxID=87 RepID=UPI000C4839FB|nr:hypothetical protein [Hyphomonas sp.]MAB09946.1 hypothetical protein [Hyphomonas sp.]MAU66694.1 hypothetical protein [Hyphomonas sp.]MBM57654.1 hypothetical protein [Hyphomonas sp.]
MKRTAYGIIICLLVTTAQAQEWANIATQNGLTSGRLCQTDGADIICDTNSPEVNAGGLNATQLCDEAGDNCKDLSTGWATSLTPDSLDWSDMKDAMTLDAATDISTSGNNLSVNTDDLIVEGTTGKVGIGTLPTNARLDVAGAVKVADETDTCSSADDEGKIRYTAGEFSFCQDYTAGWETFADVAPAAGGGGGSLLAAYDKDDNVLGVFIAFITNTYRFYNLATKAFVDLGLTDFSPATVTVNDRVFFRYANCSGTLYIDSTYSTGWGCSGAGTCKTNPVKGYSSASSNNYQSYRNTDGSCVNASGSRTTYNANSAGGGSNPDLCASGADGTDYHYGNCYIGLYQ